MPNPGRNPPPAPVSTMYPDVRGRQLEGTFPGDPTSGVWVVTGARIYRGWGNVTESDWPFVHMPHWPGIEPPGLDARAKKNRYHHYQRVRSANDCRIILADRCTPIAAFEITEQWFDAPKGIIRMPADTDEIIGSHAVAILGFDLNRQCFLFVNSWGEEWGSGGFGWLSFAYFDKYLVESWALHDWIQRERYEDFEGIERLEWGNVDVLGHSRHGGDTLHGREIYDGTNDEMVGWAFAVHRDGFLDIEELFVRPTYRDQGIANQLIEMLLQLSEECQQPLRYWVPYADWSIEQLPRVERIMSKLGLKLYASGVRWAPVVGVDPRYVEETSEPHINIGTTPSQAQRPSKYLRMSNAKLETYGRIT